MLIYSITAFWHNKTTKAFTTMNKSVSERWWNLYLDDRRCKRHFNGLHLVCAMYGDCPEDSDTLMQSMAGNKNYQLENFEFTDDESLFKDTLSTSMWNDQHPEGSL